MEPMEIISDGDQPLIYLIRGGWLPEKTRFLTPDCCPQQLGMIVRGADENIPRHVHLPVMRTVVGTTECIMVRRGSCDLDVYDRRKKLITSRQLRIGDTALLLDGGHGFRMREDTVLFEVKQGPYMGVLDKERF